VDAGIMLMAIELFVGFPSISSPVKVMVLAADTGPAGMTLANNMITRIRAKHFLNIIT
jgi:hypothetical protein